MALTWQDVDWAGHRLTVHSPKTACHVGHDKRIIPLFPEIAQPLQQVFDEADDGQVYILPFLRERTSAALRKPMFAAIERAGLTPWPRLWNNLRSSRQTELVSRFPSHVVCAWLGNSERIVQRHYLQVRGSDFDKALEQPVEEVVHNAVRAMAINDDNARQVQGGESRRNAKIQHKTLMSANVEKDQTTPTGFEPVLPG